MARLLISAQSTKNRNFSIKLRSTFISLLNLAAAVHTEGNKTKQ